MPEPKYCHNLLRLTLVSQDQSGGTIQMQLLGGPIGVAQNGRFLLAHPKAAVNSRRVVSPVK